MDGAEIYSEIRSDNYFCLICTSHIDYKTEIWSCGTCYRIYCLSCIRNWAARAKNNEPWKCPHCLSPQKNKPAYFCWCKKQRNPEFDSLTPHSCGQTCNIKLGCIHRCTALCHPGPHRECRSMGPELSCFCGKKSTRLLCLQTAYQGVSCGQVCGKLHQCQKHNCRKKCHKGGCGPCKVPTYVQCKCGKSRQRLPCSKATRSEAPSCKKECGKTLDCGLHKCHILCHTKNNELHKCKDKPKPNERCPCGATLVSEILGHERESCTETIPTCTKVCGKIHSRCGHKCEELCHEGECTPCYSKVSRPCRCGGSLVETVCADTVPLCLKVCNGTLNCKRHKCTEVCCRFALIAKERGRKQKQGGLTLALAQLELSVSEEESAFHLCTQTCNRVLVCGHHRCIKLCHSGACPPCMSFSSDDYVCPCGKTVLEAPIRCGTELPDCHYACMRPQSCGHTPAHACHDDSEPCPRCTRIVMRTCTCGKIKLPMQCCETEPVRCAQACEKRLECGHTCKVVCHDGPCPPCTSICGCPYDCGRGHVHKGPCHGLGTDCGKCETISTARCPCGRIGVEFICGEDLEVFCNEDCLNKEPPYNPVILDTYTTAPKWCIAVEKQLRVFAQDEQAKSLLFKPMRKPQRRFVHYLLEHYKIHGTSLDRGPNRAVRGVKTPETWQPRHTIGRALALSKIHGVDSTDPPTLDVLDEREFISD